MEDSVKDINKEVIDFSPEIEVRLEAAFAIIERTYNQTATN